MIKVMIFMLYLYMSCGVWDTLSK